MFIAQCSLKSRQCENADQWISPEAWNGEVHSKQATEEAECFSLKRVKNDCAVGWRHIKGVGATSRIEAFTHFFIFKKKSDIKHYCETAGQSPFLT